LCDNLIIINKYKKFIPFLEKLKEKENAFGVGYIRGKSRNSFGKHKLIGGSKAEWMFLAKVILWVNLCSC